MKIKFRFSAHFIIGLFIWIIGMGLTAMFTIDVIFPSIGVIEENKGYDLLVLMVFLLNITLCSMLFAWYFGSPLWFMMSWIQLLTQGKYEAPFNKSKIYTRKGKLRKPYRLYEEVIINIHSLAEHLKQAEQERMKMEELKKDWMAGISHDLKTPLTYITGYSALLLNKEYVWTEEEKNTFIKTIAQKGEHMEALIQDLNLSFQINSVQSPLPLNLSKTNIVEFIQNLIADIGNDPKAFEYNLSFHSDEKIIKSEFDAQLMYRALQNLLINAIIHNPSGTSIHVEIVNEKDRFVTITISDDGVGMDQDTIDNLFKKYYRGTATNSSDLGTGLGMAIVKNLILAHGGHIKVNSELSLGTKINITLPHTHCNN
ncbi:sensor histidine kinase [Niallia sp. 01092]|uniref:sensor histidine kinase n=1 Tax=Niallia sp. 01092 TaxID=3457759 RepID=UPI003FD61823